MESKATKRAAKRGRRPKNKAVRDFIIADAIAIEYDPKLADAKKARKLRRSIARSTAEILPRSDLSLHEQIAEYMQQTRKELGNISSKRLLNLMSEFRNAKVPESDEIPPDDRDPPNHLG